MKKIVFIFLSILFTIYIVIPIMWCCMFGFTIWFIHKGDIKPFLKPIASVEKFIKPVLIKTSLLKE